MKSSALLVFSIFLLSACAGTERAATAQAEPAPAPVLSTAATSELTDAGLEYFDRNLPNRAAYRAAWHLQEKSL